MKANFSTKVKYIKTKIKDLKPGDILLRESCKTCLCQLEDNKIIEENGKKFRKAINLFDCKEHPQPAKYLLVYFTNEKYVIILKG